MLQVLERDGVVEVKKEERGGRPSAVPRRQAHVAECPRAVPVLDAVDFLPPFVELSEKVNADAGLRTVRAPNFLLEKGRFPDTAIPQHYDFEGEMVLRGRNGGLGHATREREKKGGWVATVQWCRERNWEDGTF